MWLFARALCSSSMEDCRCICWWALISSKDSRRGAAQKKRTLESVVIRTQWERLCGFVWNFAPRCNSKPTSSIPSTTYRSRSTLTSIDSKKVIEMMLESRMRNSKMNVWLSKVGRKRRVTIGTAEAQLLKWAVQLKKRNIQKWLSALHNADYRPLIVEVCSLKTGTF